MPDEAPTIESKDGSELYLYIKPTQLAGNLEFNRLLLRRMQGIIDRLHADYPQLKLAPTGAYAIRVEEDEVMQGDLSRAAILAALVSFGIILLASRRPVALVIVALPVAIGIAATFAFAYVLIGHLNPVTGFLGAILIGLGIEYGVHLSMRYWEEREHHDPLPAMKEALLGTYSGALTSAATNSAVFFVLVFAEFEAFKQFGKIASFGVLATLCAAYLVGPSILFLAEHFRPFRRRASPNDAAGGWTGWGLNRPALVALLVSMLCAAGFGLLVSDRVGFETNLRNLKGESPATELDDHVHEQLGLIMVPALVYVDSLEDARTVAALAEGMRARDGEKSAFAKVASMNDLVPWDSAPRLEVIRKIEVLLEGLPKSVKAGAHASRVKQLLEMTSMKPWGPEEVPLEVRRRFSALDGAGTFVLIFPRFSGYDVNNLQAWARDLTEVINQSSENHVELHVLDGNRIAAKIFALIKKDGPLIMLLAAAVVFGMIWISLRSLHGTMLVAGPLYLGMICILGAMYLFDVHLNFLNVVVLPNLLAIAVDNSVHLFHRYREEGRGSLGHIMRHTGYAAGVATFSNAAGYGAMLIARHEGLRSVGVLAVLGVGCTFWGTTVVFPALLSLLEGRARETA
jgi:predicted RND superfamily exporter protein